MRKTRVSREVARTLEEGLLNGEDVGEMLARLKVGSESFRRWLNSPGVLGRLAARCLSEDLQTALVISRYRPLAASRLGEMAIKQDGGEMTRRACVDLLRVDLTRAAADLAGVVAAGGKRKRSKENRREDSEALLRAIGALQRERRSADDARGV